MSMHKDPIKLVCCIIASHDDVYDAYKKEWIRYITTAQFKDVDFYFIYNGATELTVNKMNNFTDIYFPFEESVKPGIFKKTIAFYEYLQSTGVSYTHMLRTNLSSFFKFEGLIDLLHTQDKTNLVLGNCVNNAFPSGCGTVFSSDVIEKLLTLHSENQHLSSIPEYDDVIIGLMLTHLKIGVISYDYVNLCNQTDEDVQELLKIPHFHYVTNDSAKWFRQLVNTYMDESTIGQNYTVRCNTDSDINEHLPTLKKYAEECTHITECGVRSVVSSYAFARGLLGKPNTRLIQVDLDYVPQISVFQYQCKKYGVQTLFHKMSDLDCPMEETELLFIDTWHIYGHLKRELARWNSHVSKYIILHDTTVDEWKGETIRCNWNAEEQSRLSGIPVEEITKGLWPAVEEFLEDHPEWILHERFVNNNGLTVIKRIS
jgi:hypothetical protein